MLNITTITTAVILQSMCSYINIVRLQPVTLYFLPIIICCSDYIFYIIVMLKIVLMRNLVWCVPHF